MMMMSSDDDDIRLLTEDDWLEIVVDCQSCLSLIESIKIKKHPKIKQVLDSVLTSPWSNSRLTRLRCITALCLHNENIAIRSISSEDQRRVTCIFCEESSDKDLLEIATIQTNINTKEICYSEWFIIHKKYIPFITACTWLASIENYLFNHKEHSNELYHLNKSIQYINRFLELHETNPLQSSTKKRKKEDF